MGATYGQDRGSLAVHLGTTGCGAEARRDGVGADDMRFVDQKRRECPHISWQALADMTQRNVHDLRMRCDPGYAARFGGSVVSPQAPLGPQRRPAVRRTLDLPAAGQAPVTGSQRAAAARRSGYEGSVCPGTMQAKALLLLNEAPLGTAEIGAQLGLGSAASSALAQSLLRKKVARAIRPRRKGPRRWIYVLTPMGSAEAKRLQAERAYG